MRAAAGPPRRRRRTGSLTARRRRVQVGARGDERARDVVAQGAMYSADRLPAERADAAAGGEEALARLEVAARRRRVEGGAADCPVRETRAPAPRSWPRRPTWPAKAAAWSRVSPNGGVASSTSCTRSVARSRRFQRAHTASSWGSSSSASCETCFVSDARSACHSFSATSHELRLISFERFRSSRVSANGSSEWRSARGGCRYDGAAAIASSRSNASSISCSLRACSPSRTRL